MLGDLIMYAEYLTVYPIHESLIPHYSIIIIMIIIIIIIMMLRLEQIRNIIRYTRKLLSPLLSFIRQTLVTYKLQQVTIKD